jgi:hypothetical protein
MRFERACRICAPRPTAAAIALSLWLCSCSSPPERTSGTGDEGVEGFLTTYFATWSAGNMSGYADHFHPSAVITVVRNGHIAAWTARDRFVSQQVEARERSGGTSVERMLSYESSVDEYAATAVAEWELRKGSGVDATITRGIDRFTLMRDEQGAWKIVALVFYATE